MDGCYNSSVRKKYVWHDSLLDFNVYHTRDIENLHVVKVSVKWFDLSAVEL